MRAAIDPTGTYRETDVPAKQISSRNRSMDSAHLDNLNQQQLEAVLHEDGPLLVFAGAGSGKTRVLTRRIVHLIKEHRVHPDSILAVTFTNKAAKEMKHRIAATLGPRALRMWVSTFHSFCVRILREHARLLDYSPHFAIYDSSDSLSALKRVYKRHKIDPKQLDPKMVRSQIDRAKNDYLFPDDIKDNPYLRPEIAELVAFLYEKYQEELTASNAMDFGDLLGNVVTLFTLEKSLLERYQKQFRYLLIDEYQDTNQVQYLLIQMLAKAHKNICVVGDDDQSIYAFRGATIENILNFNADYPEAKIITLSQNYRSTKNILSVANAVIANNQTRQPKQMTTDNADGEKVTLYTTYNENDEAQIVVREICAAFERGVKAKDIAIFYRTNAQSRALEESLREENISYEIFGGHKFYERKEIKDIIAYLKLSLNTSDNEAFLRVINTPTRGLGPSALAQLITLSERSKTPLFEAIASIDSSNASAAQKKKKFLAFKKIIDGIQDQIQSVNTTLGELSIDSGQLDFECLGKLIKYIAENSGYIALLKKQDTVEAESRIENIEELYRVALDFPHRELEQGRTPMVEAFLDRASLASDAESENIQRFAPGNSSNGSVSLMTLHLAKGLEFDHVFFVGMEEGLLPHVRSIDSAEDIEEERRLCYVGMTRAKERLILSRTIMRTSFGRNSWYSGQASRFLDEIPEDLLDEQQSSAWEE